MLIRFDGQNHSTADCMVVAVYELGREYGGPEEGGWYYDTREIVAVAVVPEGTNEAALKLCDELESGEYKQTGRDVGSVNYRGGSYGMYIHEAGERIVHNEPEETPHYE